MIQPKILDNIEDLKIPALKSFVTDHKLDDMFHFQRRNDETKMDCLNGHSIWKRLGFIFNIQTSIAWNTFSGRWLLIFICNTNDNNKMLLAVGIGIVSSLINETERKKLIINSKTIPHMKQWFRQMAKWQIMPTGSKWYAEYINIYNIRNVCCLAGQSVFG